MKMASGRPLIFISHASADAWVARQLSSHVQAAGADAFLDCEKIAHGDDFEEKIVAAANEACELLVLFTPLSRDRKYVWLEIGMFLGAKKRIVAVLYGVSKTDIAVDPFMPVALKRIDSVDIDDVDSYFSQLAERLQLGSFS